MIDSHAHLLPDFVRNIDKIINNARISGLKAVINSAIEPHHFKYAVELEKQNPHFIFSSFGFSPSKIKTIDFEESYNFIHKYPSMVAIGEVGLDYHWIHESFWQEKQLQVFSKFVELANEYNKPLVIHSRKAETDCINFLEKNADVPVLLHCFSGTISQARRILNHGWLLSIPTAVKNRKKHRKLARNIPLENIVVETDTPFLSPFPGKKNEPANVKYAIEEIAKLKETSFQEVVKATTQNCKIFFKI
ncbi:MAG: TatD family hydrolase [Candidatus Hodarchaeales archaeon]|jgi:TatD DNase family protein